MAFSDTNNQSRSNITRMAETLGGMKQNQAGMMQKTRMQNQLLSSQTKENAVGRFQDMLKQGAGIAGDYLSKSQLAKDAEGRQKKAYGEDGYMRDFETSILDKKNELEGELITLRATTDREYQEWLNEEGGVMEAATIRGEGRQTAAEIAAEGRAETATIAAEGRSQEAYETNIAGERAYTDERDKTLFDRDIGMAETRFGREQELEATRAENNRANVQMGIDADLAKYGEGSPYYEFMKDSAEWNSLAEISSRLAILAAIAAEPEKYGEVDPDSSYEGLVSGYLEEMYLGEQAKAQAAGSAFNKEVFKDAVLLNLRANVNSEKYGARFVVDVKAIMDEYIDVFFSDSPPDGEVTAASGELGGFPEMVQDIETGATALGRGLSAQSEGIMALSGYIFGFDPSKNPNSATGKENRAIEELEGFKRFLSQGSARETLDEYITQISDPDTIIPEVRLQQMLKVAKQYADASGARRGGR